VRGKPNSKRAFSVIQREGQETGDNSKTRFQKGIDAESVAGGEGEGPAQHEERLLNPVRKTVR